MAAANGHLDIVEYLINNGVVRRQLYKNILLPNYYNKQINYKDIFYNHYYQEANGQLWTICFDDFMQLWT